MKKLLSILGVIGLTATSTTSLISCEKQNNNENGRGSKPEPWKPEKPKSEQPPIGSKWKLINDYNSFEQNIDSHWYFVIWKNQNKEWKIVKFKHKYRWCKKNWGSNLYS